MSLAESARMLGRARTPSRSSDVPEICIIRFDGGVELIPLVVDGDGVVVVLHGVQGVRDYSVGNKVMGMLEVNSRNEFSFAQERVHPLG